VNPLAGWELISATAINDAGFIVGYGQIGGQSRAFLLSPNNNFLPGDFNRDGHANTADIRAMLLALADLKKYETEKGLSDSQLLTIGDINSDGKLTNADVQPFLNLLKSGGGSIAAVAEPSTVTMCFLGLSIFLAFRAAQCAFGLQAYCSNPRKCDIFKVEQGKALHGTGRADRSRASSCGGFIF
jgi:hypothetical protein